MSSLAEPSTHWFYRSKDELVWHAFSLADSTKIENLYQKEFTEAHNLKNQEDSIVSTDGGRYDVCVNKRTRKAIYWEEDDCPVLRGTWSYRQNQGQLHNIPFDEETAKILESEYIDSLTRNSWDKHVKLPDRNDVVIFHSANVLKYYTDYSLFRDDYTTIDWSKGGDVSRGISSLDFPTEEKQEDSSKPEHLVFVVHGIGEICDLRFRNLIDVVDDFRVHVDNAMKILGSDQQKISPTFGRIELLPIFWHSALHGEKTGIDDQLRQITLKSIPKLRNFCNDTILDALLYTSPIFCQHIKNTVCSEISRVYNLFKARNPNFTGSVSLMGHSLGSLIIFDILNSQRKKHLINSSTTVEDVEFLLRKLKLDDLTLNFLSNNFDTFLHTFEQVCNSLSLPSDSQAKILNFLSNARYEQALRDTRSPGSGSSTLIQDEMVAQKHGQNLFISSQLDFEPLAFFAIGSPIPVFLTVRGLRSLQKSFKFPTCQNFFNIFHPFDPIAYRLEPLFDKSFANLSPVQIPHHKGRKRMHLQLRENLWRMGSGLRERVVQSIKPVWDSLNAIKRIQMSPSPSMYDVDVTDASTDDGELHRSTSTQELETSNSQKVSDDPLEQRADDTLVPGINGGGRIDYVLQEKPIEFFNEYIFALATHACYWASEDTALFIVRKINELSCSSKR